MRKTFFTTAAMAALIGTAGMASAQAPNNAPNAPAATQSAPSGMQGAPAVKTVPMNRGDSSGGMKGGQAEMPREGGKAASDTTLDKSKDGMKAGQKNAAEGKAGPLPDRPVPARS